MWSKIANVLGGSIVSSVERVALEVIETDKESAEAKSLWIKTLDPNGKMRRDLSRFASRAYGFYLAATTVLIFCHSFDVGNAEMSADAIEAMTGLFLPITGSWATIVTASFGVNATNVVKKKDS
jgi:hypothetical protein